MQITGSRGLPEPGGSRGSTDRKAYKAVSLSPGRLSLSLSLSSPPGGSPVVSPSAHARALAPATVTAPYISRGSGGGGGTGVTSTDIKVVLARAGVRSPTLVEIFDFYDTRRERTAEARRGGGGGANSTDREGKREKEREQDRTSLVPATVFTSYSLPHSPPIAPLFFPLSLSLFLLLFLLSAILLATPGFRAPFPRPDRGIKLRRREARKMAIRERDATFSAVGVLVGQTELAPPGGRARKEGPASGSAPRDRENRAALHFQLIPVPRPRSSRPFCKGATRIRRATEGIPGTAARWREPAPALSFSRWLAALLHPFSRL